MGKSKLGKLIFCLLATTLFLTACGGLGGKESSKKDDKFVIGISQLAEHPALDATRQGFEDGIKDLGIDGEIVYQNAQGDITIALSIAEKFVKDRVDLIYTIATPAAQAAKQATGEIPILFSAVTDPVVDELIESLERPGGNITGTSDKSPMEEQLALFKEIDSSIEKIGIVFNTSESNSKIQVDMAEEMGEMLGLEIISMGISNINDMPQAMDSLVKKVDGIYTITDNMVASAINVVSQKATSNGLVSVGAEEAHVAGGILISKGISYYELGRQTAQMAKEILVEGKSPANIPAQTSNKIEKTFNEETLKTLNLDINSNIFKDAKKID